MHLDELRAGLACSALALLGVSCSGTGNTSLITPLDSGADSFSHGPDGAVTDGGGSGHDSGHVTPDAGDAGHDASGDTGAPPTCTAAAVCGNGSGGTKVNTSYTCSGRHGAPSSCRRGHSSRSISSSRDWAAPM
jgi:hypothetical protein